MSEIERWSLIVITIALFGAGNQAAADAPSQAVGGPLLTQGGMVNYPGGDDTLAAYVATPAEVDGPLPAVIVIHEWWGLNNWVRENADRFAGLGYVALAVDLYRGRSATDSGEAHELMRGLPELRAERDLRAAFAYLRGRDDVDPDRIGAIGWCMGGGYSLVAALSLPELGSAVICYGRLSVDREAMSGVGASMLGIFGGEDRGISVESVRAFEQTMRDLGKEIEVHVYAGSGHAFMNPGNERGYNPEDATTAWAEIDAFLKRTLKSP